MRVAVIVVAIVMVATPSHASKSCMTMAEARQQFRTSHLYWHGAGHCWDANAPVHGIVRHIRQRSPEQAEQDNQQQKKPARMWRRSPRQSWRAAKLSRLTPCLPKGAEWTPWSRPPAF